MTHPQQFTRSKNDAIVDRPARKVGCIQGKKRLNFVKVERTHPVEPTCTRLLPYAIKQCCCFLTPARIE